MDSGLQEMLLLKHLLVQECPIESSSVEESLFLQFSDIQAPVSFEIQVEFYYNSET